MPILFCPPMAGELTLPNVLTIARILAIPAICVLVVAGDPTLRMIAIGLYILAAFSDWLDGYLARRMKTGSDLGRMLDPIADKLLVVALIVALAWTRDLTNLDLIAAIAIVMREIIVSGMREYLGPKNIVLHVTPYAKWKTAAQLIALGLVMAVPLSNEFILFAIIFLWGAAGLTVWTGIDYVRQVLPHLRNDAPKNDPP